MKLVKPLSTHEDFLKQIDADHYFLAWYVETYPDRVAELIAVARVFEESKL